MSKANRTCGNCGNTQGPFDRLFIGDRKTGRWVFTCPIPKKDADGKPLTDNARRELAMVCTNRREKRNGATSQVVPVGDGVVSGPAGTGELPLEAE